MARVKIHRWKIIVILLLPIQILVVNLLNASWVEQYYSNRLYPHISNSIKAVSRIFPFSISEMLIISLTGFLFYKIFKSLFNYKKITFASAKNTALNGLVFFSILYSVFQITWGLNYQRLSIEDSLNINRTSYTAKELEHLCHNLIFHCNQIRDAFPEDSFTTEIQQIFISSSIGFRNNPDIKMTNEPSIKSVLLSKGMSIIGIGGIYFPFTSEANVNTDMPRVSIPFTACHEIAHQLGYAKEDEANYVSYIVCLNNENPMFQYSAYFSALKYAMSELAFYDYEKMLDLKIKCSSKVLNDFKEHKEYWQKFRNPLMDYSENLNDLYLKANSQEEGIESYNLFLDESFGLRI